MPRDDEQLGRTIDPVTRDIRFLSVSQVTTFDPEEEGGCNRAWYFERVLGKKKPKTRSQEIGDEVHAQIERYLKTGESVLGQIAIQGKHFLPRPLTEAPGILIEHKIGGAAAVYAYEAWRKNVMPAMANRHRDDPVFQAGVAWAKQHLPAGVLEAHDTPFIGYVDVLNFRNYWVDTEGTCQPMGPDEVEIHDHKTTSSIADYAKAQPDTTQMVGYAEWVRRVAPYVKRIRLSHGNLQTRGRGAEKRSIVVSLPVVQERWAGVSEQVLRMRQVARELDVSHVEPHYPSCNAFGYKGCAHKEYCPRDPMRVLVDMFGLSPSAEGATTSMTTTMPQNNAHGVAPNGVGVLGAVPPLCGAPGCGLPILQGAPPQGNLQTHSDGRTYHTTHFVHEVVWPGGAAPGGVVATMPAGLPSGSAPGAAPRRMLDLRHCAVLRNRQNGSGVLIARDQRGWWFCNVVGDAAAIASWSPTMSEAWFEDVWEDCGTAHEGVLSSGRLGVVAPNAASSLSQVAHPAQVAPPDAPASTSPGYANPVPPGVTLPPAVASIAEQHAAQAAAATGQVAAQQASDKQLALFGGAPVGGAASATGVLPDATTISSPGAAGAPAGSSAPPLDAQAGAPAEAAQVGEGVGGAGGGAGAGGGGAEDGESVGAWTAIVRAWLDVTRPPAPLARSAIAGALKLSGDISKGDGGKITRVMTALGWVKKGSGQDTTYSPQQSAPTVSSAANTPIGGAPPGASQYQMAIALAERLKVVPADEDALRALEELLASAQGYRSDVPSDGSIDDSVGQGFVDFVTAVKQFRGSSPTAAHATSAPAAPATPTAPVVAGALLLFVDCAAPATINGVPVRDLESYVAERHAWLLKRTNCDKFGDVRLAPQDHQLGYGKWKAAMELAVKSSPPTGPCRLRVGGDDLKAAVLAGLRACAGDNVVEPLK